VVGLDESGQDECFVEPVAAQWFIRCSGPWWIGGQGGDELSLVSSIDEPCALDGPDGPVVGDLDPSGGA
jgi:hypothetical protein